MLTEGHIFTIKTKDPDDVAHVSSGDSGVVISGLNVLKDKIQIGDFVFVVFGGDKPKGWTPGFVALAHITQAPFDEGYDGKSNFRVAIDVDVYFQPSILRSDLIYYPNTYDIIGIGPITKWEPNQAITAVQRSKAVALLQAICELRPDVKDKILDLVSDAATEICGPVKRFLFAETRFGEIRQTPLLDLREEFIAWAPNKKPVRGKAASEGTLKKYVGYLGCFEAPVAPEGKKCGSGWDGIIEYLLGSERRQKKEYYQIGTVKEFDETFGIVKKIFNGEEAPADAIADHYAKVSAWASTEYFKKHACFESAYDAYREFLEWREQHNSAVPDIAPASNRRYWLIAPGEDAKFWGDWTENGIATIGWDFLGDLTKIDREEILAKINEDAADGKNHVNNALCCWQFCKEVRPGDVIIVKKGIHGLLGVGTIAGEYVYDEARDEHRHAHAVKWIATGDFTTSENLGQKTLTDLTPYPDFVYRLLTVMGVDPKQFEIAKPKENDDLTIALELFKARRDLFAEGEMINDGIRAYFDSLTPERLRAYTQEEFEDLFLGTKKYEHMWAGTNGKGWGHIKDAGCKASMEFIAKIRESPIPIDTFCDKKFDAPSGFGQVVIAELHLKFYPKDYCAYSKRTGIALEALKLKTNTYSGSFTAEDYLEVMEATEKIRKRMIDLGITRTRNDSEEADYLTANEFIDWVCNNKDLVKEKVMAERFKSVKDKSKPMSGTNKLSDMMKDELLKRLAAALCTKPFAILAGHSGTGKSQLVRRLAYMTCADEGLMAEAEKNNAPGNYCMIQVKPNWHDSTDLLGYYSEITHQFRTTDFVRFVMKAYAYPKVPFFVCLDEMNLAPVEQYFAEYLSAIESASDKTGEYLTDPLVSKDYAVDEVADTDECRFSESKQWFEQHGLTIPQNLFVVGTVNMDETTCQFSRKVLDRAMTLLMNEVKFGDMEKSKEPDKTELLDADGIAFFLQGGRRGHVGSVEAAKLDKLNDALENTPFVVAYRFANEYALYEEALANLDGLAKLKNDPSDKEKQDYRAEVSKKADVALDDVVLMKLLPRIHGLKEVVTGIFNGRKIKEKDVPGVKDAVKLSSGEGKSAKMMEEILEREGEYLTFWP